MSDHDFESIKAEHQANVNRHRKEFEKERDDLTLLWALWAIGSLVFLCCIAACIGGCVYYCIKSNQHQRTAAMAQHQAVYQPGMAGMVPQTTVYASTSATGGSSGGETDTKLFGSKNTV